MSNQRAGFTLEGIGAFTYAVVFFAAGLVLGYYAYTLAESDLSREEMQDEFNGYALCMESAGTTRCSMQPADFVRFFELKRELEPDQ